MGEPLPPRPRLFLLPLRRSFRRSADGAAINASLPQEVAGLQVDKDGRWQQITRVRTWPTPHPRPRGSCPRMRSPRRSGRPSTPGDLGTGTALPDHFSFLRGLRQGVISAVRQEQPLVQWTGRLVGHGVDTDPDLRRCRPCRGCRSNVWPPRGRHVRPSRIRCRR
jgi:hypothetical protein